MNAIPATIHLVDDDPGVLRSLGRLLRSNGYDVKAFGSAADFLGQHRTSGPGCMIVDLRMPEMTGLELQRKLQEMGTTLPVIFLSGEADVPSSVRALKNGAVDFLTKPVDEPELLAAVRSALERQAAERAAREELENLQRRFASLSEREQSVCLRVARGLLNKEIAFELDVAERTVKAHRSRVMEKLGVDSVPEMVRIVDKLGVR